MQLTQGVSDEIWKPVVGYEGIYDVSSYGRIRRVSTGLILAGSLSANYPYVVLCMNGLEKNWRIHVLVANAFLGICPEGFEVNHKDLNRLNNNLSNLEYTTHAGNLQHRYHGMAFTDEQIEQVVKLLQKRIRPRYSEIEKATGVPISHIQTIASRTPNKGKKKRPKLSSTKRARMYFEEFNKG